MADSASNNVLLTLDDVRALVVERSQIKLELEKLNTRYQHIESKLEVVSLFLSKEQQANILLDSASDDDRQSDDSDGAVELRGKWPPVLFEILRASKYGMTTADFKKELKDHPLGEEVGMHGNVLYSALMKMVHKKTIIKDGDYYCLKGQGKPDGAFSIGDTGSLIQEQIILALKSFNQPVEAKRVLSFLLTSPAESAVKRSPTYPYNMLSKMAVSGRVIRDGGLYSLPPDENEPSDGDTSDGSDAGSGKDVFA